MTARSPAALKAQMPIGVNAAISSQDIHDIVDSYAARTVASVRDFGAVGDGTTDDTAAIQAALNQGAGKMIYFPAGTYRTTAPLGLSGIANMGLVGDEGMNTTIQMFGNGEVMSLTTATFCSIKNLSFQHGSGTGSGLAFWGSGGSNNVERCLFANNSDHGLAFSGTAAVPQSSNRVSRCLFLANGTEQLYFAYSNDAWIDGNAFGNATAPYSTAGCKLFNSSAGNYSRNQHWGNVNGLVLDTSHYMIVAGNRIEESRNEGVVITGSGYGVLSHNMVHTNSQSASGTYSAVRLAASTNWAITGNQVLSWDSATYKHKHGVEANAASTFLNIAGNSINHTVLGIVNTGGAPNVWRANNSPLETNAMSERLFTGPTALASNSNTVYATFSLPAGSRRAHGGGYVRLFNTGVANTAVFTAIVRNAGGTEIGRQQCSVIDAVASSPANGAIHIMYDWGVALETGGTLEIAGLMTGTAAGFNVVTLGAYINAQQ